MKDQNSLQMDRASGGRRRRDARCAFSLTELLVCISIVGILLALTFPAAQAVRQAARRTYCLSNLKQVMLATLTYEAKGTGFPPADDGQGRSFIVSLLPNLEEPRIADRARSNLAPGESYRDRWAELSQQQIVPLICPASDPDDSQVTLPGQGEFTSHYYGIAGPVGAAQDPESLRFYSYQQATTPANGPIGLQGIFGPRNNGSFAPKYLKDVTDGISHTFGIGEISRFEVADSDTQPPKRSGWAFGADYDSSRNVASLYSVKSVGRPINSVGNTLNDWPFGSNHPGGTQFAMLDGSVHFVEQNVSLDILKMFSSINEREKTNGLNEY